MASRPRRIEFEPRRISLLYGKQARRERECPCRANLLPDPDGWNDAVKLRQSKNFFRSSASSRVTYENFPNREAYHREHGERRLRFKQLTEFFLSVSNVQ